MYLLYLGHIVWGERFNSAELFPPMYSSISHKSPKIENFTPHSSLCHHWIVWTLSRREGWLQSRCPGPQAGCQPPLVSPDFLSLSSGGSNLFCLFCLHCLFASKQKSLLASSLLLPASRLRESYHSFRFYKICDLHFTYLPSSLPIL